LNITCKFVYCNHQVHRDFLITLYIPFMYYTKYVQVDDDLLIMSKHVAQLNTYLVVSNVIRKSARFVTLREVERVRMCDSKMLREVLSLMKVSKRRMAGWRNCTTNSFVNCLLNIYY
jgi:hypothetical protein